ncbi:MAG: GGDEF domain-containing protein [Spirochaetota bacterium]
MKKDETSTLQFLRKVGIFSSLEDHELGIVESFLSSTEAESDRILFREGDEGDRLFVIRSGRVGITVNVSSGEPFEVASFGPGECFGEMTLFDNAPRSATCTTREFTSFYTLDVSDFDRLIRAHPSIAIKIMYRMLNITTERLSNSSNFLSDMVQWGEGARKRAITDEFTGLYNRRYLDEAIEEQLANARASGKPLAVMMFDLDHFHAINDTYGEKVGDQVIKDLVPIIRSVFRESDYPARYGGDEFTVLLPDTDSSTALHIAQELVKKVATVDTLSRQGGPISTATTSVGVAVFPDHGRTGKELSDRADAALYQAKEGGRNQARVYTYTGEEVTP